MIVNKTFESELHITSNIYSRSMAVQLRSLSFHRTIFCATGWHFNQKRVSTRSFCVMKLNFIVIALQEARFGGAHLLSCC